MTKHELCSTFGDFADAQEERAFIVLEARRIVLWAGSLTQPGEEIGGKGQQLERAARLLQLHEGVVWRAYQRRSGPEIFPTIWEARNKLIERLAKSPWANLGDAFPKLQTSVGYQPRQVTAPISGKRIRRCG